MGIKNFCIVDNAGYIYHFWVYHSKKNKANEGNIVHNYMWNLVQKLPADHKYIIFTDQFYRSMGLTCMLQEYGYQFVLSYQANHLAEIFSSYL